MMIDLKLTIGAALMAASMCLAGCYETSEGVLGRGEHVAVPAGSYRCQNDKDREVGAATISAPARLGADDVIYVATLDKDRYGVRISALPGGLFLLEARGDFRGVQHAFVRRQGNDGYDLLVTNPRVQGRLTELARTHGVTIEFPNYGPPRIQGAPDRVRAFLLAHTPAELQRTATCRRVA